MLAGIIAALVGAWLTGVLMFLGWLVKRLVNKVDTIADHISTLAPKSDVDELRETQTLHLIESADDRATLRAHLARHA